MQLECPNFAGSANGAEPIYKDLRSDMDDIRFARDRYGKRRPSFES